MSFQVLITICNVAVVTQILRFTCAFTQQDTLRSTPAAAILVVICCSTVSSGTCGVHNAACRNIKVWVFADDIRFFCIRTETHRQYQNGYMESAKAVMLILQEYALRDALRVPPGLANLASAPGRWTGW